MNGYAVGLALTLIGVLNQPVGAVNGATLLWIIGVVVIAARLIYGGHRHAEHQ